MVFEHPNIVLASLGPSFLEPEEPRDGQNGHRLGGRGYTLARVGLYSEQVAHPISILIYIVQVPVQPGRPI